MRRLLTVAFLAVLVSTSAACGQSDDTTTTAATTGAPSPSASPSPTVDLAASNKAVCAKAEKIVTEDNFKPIGEQIGLMIAAKQAKNKANETKAAAKAKELADGVAAQVRALKTEAADPKMQAALDKAAAGIELFGAPDTLAKITSLNDMNALTGQITQAGADLDALCA